MFNIIFYKNTSESNRLDKTNYIEDPITIQGTLKEDCSIINPSILIDISSYNIDNILTKNYAYISVFNRYYFINNFTFLTNNIMSIDLNVDVLMSFKSEIIELGGILKRTSNEDYMSLNVIDYEVPFTKTENIEVEDIYPMDGFYDFITSGVSNNIKPTLAFETMAETDDFQKGNIINAGQLKKYGSLVNFSGSEYIPNSTNDGVYFLDVNNIPSDIVPDIIDDIINQIANDTTISDFFLSFRVYPFAYGAAVDRLQLVDIFPIEGAVLIPYNKTMLKVLTSETIQGATVKFLTSASQQKPNYIFEIEYNSFEHFGDFRDYKPYTTYELVLPFDEVIEIDPFEFSKYPICVITYIINFKTGYCDVYVILTDTYPSPKDIIAIDNAKYLRLYHNSFKIAIDIPINKSNNENINREKQSLGLKTIGKLIASVFTNIGSGLGGVFGDNPGKTVAAPFNQLADISEIGFDYFAQLKTLVPSGYGSSDESQVGNLCSFLQRPYIIKRSNVSAVDPSSDNFIQTKGRPSGKYGIIKNIMTGYFHSFNNIHIENVTATSDEKDIIERILKTGFMY